MTMKGTAINNEDNSDEDEDNSNEDEDNSNEVEDNKGLRRECVEL